MHDARNRRLVCAATMAIATFAPVLSACGTTAASRLPSDHPLQETPASSTDAAAPEDVAPPAPGSRRALAGALSDLGVAPLPAGLVVRGWVQQGTHWNVFDAGVEQEPFRGVDDDPGELELRQAVIVVEREPPEGAELGLGGRFKLLYGSDARATRAAGMDAGGSDPGERFDPLEMVASVDWRGDIPLRLEVGRFLSPHGYESAEAPANDFPSRGLHFTYGTPTTHTGARMTLHLAESAAVSYAAVRGWDNWHDENHRLSHTLGGSVSGSDGWPSVAANVTVGPEDRSGDRRRVLADTTLAWTPKDGDTELGLSLVRGTEENAARDGENARWGGFGAYASRPLWTATTGALRAEYFRDDGGSRTGTDARLASISAAVTVRPFPSFDAFALRFELRWDHSLDGRPFDGGRDSDQATIAIDWILEF